MAEVHVLLNPAAFDVLVHDPEVADFCEEKAQDVIRELRRRVHPVSGRTQRNFTVEKTHTPEGPAAEIRTMWYFRFVDQGTRHIRPRHIISDAIDAVAARL